MQYKQILNDSEEWETHWATIINRKQAGKMMKTDDKSDLFVEASGPCLLLLYPMFDFQSSDQVSRTPLLSATSLHPDVLFTRTVNDWPLDRYTIRTSTGQWHRSKL